MLATSGGKNPNQVVHRVMAELMSDKLMLEFTFKGLSGKESFMDTEYFNCVFG